jgi:hypothetical protein
MKLASTDSGVTRTGVNWLGLFGPLIQQRLWPNDRYSWLSGNFSIVWPTTDTHADAYCQYTDTPRNAADEQSSQFKPHFCRNEQGFESP